MSVQRISSFKTFAEIKQQQSSIKMHEENKAKRESILGQIGAALEEMGVTSLQELDEEKRKSLVAKIFNEDEAKDIEKKIVAMGEPKKEKEAAGDALKTKTQGKESEAEKKMDESVLAEGLTYEEKMIEDFLKKLAKELDYSVKDAAYFVKSTINKYGLAESITNEGNAFGDAVKKAKEAGDKEFEFDGKKYNVEEAEHVVSLQNIDEARSINKIQTEWAKVTSEMKATVDAWKKAEGDEKASLLDKLKDLTAKKKSLDAELDDAISDKDKDLELIVSEGNAFIYAAAKAKQEGKEEFEFNGKKYKVTLTKHALKEDVEISEVDEVCPVCGKANCECEKNESAKVNEADIKSDDEFSKYAQDILKKAFGEDYDEAKSKEVIDGILSKSEGDYGAAVGMLNKSLA